MSLHAIGNREDPPGRSGADAARHPISPLQGLRVLVVEDEAMVAMMIADMLEDLGCRTVGPAARVATALEMLDSELFDLALLDVNLAGERVFPVADRLAAAGIPFVFSTGYGSAGLEERYADRRVLQKPYDLPALSDALEASKKT